MNESNASPGPANQPGAFDKLPFIPAPSGTPDHTFDTHHGLLPIKASPAPSTHGAIAPATREPGTGTMLTAGSKIQAGASSAPQNLAVPGYEILGELGRGGMGVVYKARQIKANRVVALKMILGSRHVDLQDKMRFQIEAEAIARLQHPNIVQLHEVGEHDDMPFFSLEFCEGGSLDTLLKGQQVFPREAAALIQKLARAMHYAHSRGVVHRDLKPANILLVSPVALAPGGARGANTISLAAIETKITDFGLAKRTDSGSDVSRSGTIMGTPSYMAPEQAAGKVHEIGPTVDVYALGAILYELLSGRPPFKGTTAFDTIRQVLNDEPLPPSRLNPKIPRDLETICLKCLEKDAKRRYADAAALADDLARYLAGEPIAARAVSRWERALKWVRRHPAAATVYALVLIVVVLGVVGGGIFSLWRRAETAYAAADLARQQAEEEKGQKEKFLLQAEWLVYAGNIYKAQGEWEASNARVAHHYLDACRWDFRGWEHDYLYTLFNKNQRTFRGHKDHVNAVVLSADGNHIVSGSFDGTVKVWDGRTGQETLTLAGHTSGVMAVALSVDGKRIVTGSKDRTVKVWDARTGQELLTLSHTEFVGCVALSADGKRIAAGSSDHTVKVWEADTGQETLTFKGHTGYISGVAFSPDGKHIVSGSEDKTVKVWEAGTGQETLTFKEHKRAVLSLALSLDGQSIVSGSFDGTFKRWHTHTGEVPLTIQGKTAAFSGVALNRDGTRIVSGSLDGTVQVWDASTGQEILTLKGHTDRVVSLAVSADGNRIVSGSWDSTVKVWDVTTRQEPLTFKGDPDWVNRFPLGDADRIVTGSKDKTVTVRDMRTGQETLTLKGHTGVDSVAFSPDGKHIVTGSKDKAVRVWDARTGQETLTLKGHTDRVKSVIVSPDGKRIVSGSWDKTVKVWDAHTGQETLTLYGHTDTVTSLAVTPDGTRIVSGSWDGTVKVWDARTGQEILTLNGHTGNKGLNGVALSPDGKRIVSASRDETLKVWDAATGQEIMTLKGHTYYLSCVAVSPDGKRIVSGSGDGTMKVWDATTGQETLALKGHTTHVSSVVFSSDGKRMVSFSEDNTVKVWDASMSQPRVLPTWE